MRSDLTAAFCVLTIGLATTTVLGEEFKPVPRTLERNYSERMVVYQSDNTPLEFHTPRTLEIEMVWVPPGKFLMGSPEGEQGRTRVEGPQHEVEVEGFWISKYEITYEVFEGWRRSLENERRRDRAGILEPHRKPVLKLSVPPGWYAPVLGDRVWTAKMPIQAVTLTCAQTFAQWLSITSGHSYRLPTEAEWEYAARAGNRTAWSMPANGLVADYAVHLQGDVVPNIDDPKSWKLLQEVGTKLPNAWGIYDMHGNAAEWVLDSWSEDYAHRARESNPVFLAEDRTFGIVRGGSWRTPKSETRSASRRKVDRRPGVVAEDPFWYDEEEGGVDIGFRIVSPSRKSADEALLMKVGTVPKGHKGQPLSEQK